MTRFAIGARAIGPDHPPYVIAELGVNHDGIEARAVALVDAAADAGADAIKLQCFRADLLVGRTARLATYQERSGACEVHDMLSALELPASSMMRVLDRAHERGVHGIVTVFNCELVDEAAAWRVDAFKTASPDIVHQPLITALARTGRPLLVSTGAATLDEVRRAAGWLAPHAHLFMQCVSAYPAPDDDAALAGLREHGDITAGAWGYSDHTSGSETGALAVAAGACLLEKHFTLERGAVGPDHAASLEPADLATYVAGAHRAWRMLGRGGKRVLDVERDVREASRQSLTAARDLRAGQRLQRADLVFRRPGTGLAPAELGRALDCTLAADLAEGEPLTAMHLEARS